MTGLDGRSADPPAWMAGRVNGPMGRTGASSVRVGMKSGRMGTMAGGLWMGFGRMDGSVKRGALVVEG